MQLQSLLSNLVGKNWPVEVGLAFDVLSGAKLLVSEHSRRVRLCDLCDPQPQRLIELHETSEPELSFEGLVKADYPFRAPSKEQEAQRLLVEGPECVLAN